jgi:hypothetical protein
VKYGAREPKPSVIAAMIPGYASMAGGLGETPLPEIPGTLSPARWKYALLESLHCALPLASQSDCKLCSHRIRRFPERTLLGADLPSRAGGGVRP